MIDIIRQAKLEMREMLESVAEYNSSFLLTAEQKMHLEKILKSMIVIDRKYFCPVAPYLDTAMPIGEGQTISQPSTVARMLLLADLSEKQEVLEVGTGSGWNACLLAYIVYPGGVRSVERIKELTRKAGENINNLREKLNDEYRRRVAKIILSGENVFSLKKKKFDRIIITAGIEKEQEAKIANLARDLLKKEGILICPHISGPLIVYKKGKFLEKTLTNEGYVFVPLLE